MDKCVGCGKEIDVENDEAVITRVQTKDGTPVYENFCGVGCPALGISVESIARFKKGAA